MITNIQSLRGVAAMMVVVFHLAMQMRPFGIDGSQVSFLQAGVDIFFVISGFIMVFVARQRERGAGRFMADRIIRIVPLYWLLTLAAYLSPAAATRPIGDLLRSLAFIPNGTAPLFNPLIDGGWTLNLELYFYAIFAVSLAVARTERDRFMMVAAVLIAVVAAALAVPGRYWPFYGNSIVFEFVIGMALARLGERFKAIGPAAAWGMIIAGGLLIFIDPLANLGSRLASYGAPAGLIVAGALCLDSAGRRVTAPAALLLGAISYALYLSHVLLFDAIGAGLGWPSASAAPALIGGVFGVILLAALLTAWLAYSWFERPVASLLKRTLTTPARH